MLVAYKYVALMVSVSIQKQVRLPSPNFGSDGPQWVGPTRKFDKKISNELLVLCSSEHS